MEVLKRKKYSLFRSVINIEMESFEKFDVTLKLLENKMIGRREVESSKHSTISNANTLNQKEPVRNGNKCRSYDMITEAGVFQNAV